MMVPLLSMRSSGRRDGEVSLGGILDAVLVGVDPDVVAEGQGAVVVVGVAGGCWGVPGIGDAGFIHRGPGGGADVAVLAGEAVPVAVNIQVSVRSSRPSAFVSPT